MWFILEVNICILLEDEIWYIPKVDMLLHTCSRYVIHFGSRYVINIGKIYIKKTESSYVMASSGKCIY